MLRRTPIKPKRDKPRRRGPPAPRINPQREEDPEHLDAVRNLPCCVCGSWPSEAHHIRDGQVGTGQKASDHEAINLCPACHRTGPNSIHRLGTREWERRFGLQREHLKMVLAALQPGGKWIPLVYGGHK